jgi:hypothetical protein
VLRSEEHQYWLTRERLLEVMIFAERTEVSFEDIGGVGGIPVQGRLSRVGIDGALASISDLLRSMCLC